MARQIRLKFAIPILAFLLSLLSPLGKVNAENKGFCPMWEPLMKKYHLPVKTFSALAWRESRCISNAVGWNYHKNASYKNCRLSGFKTYQNCRAVRSFDSGLWQINSSWYTLVQRICGNTPQSGVLFSPDCNARVAQYLLLYGGGISNWGYKSSK